MLGNTRPYSVIVFSSDAHAVVLATAMPRPCVRVTSHGQLVDQIQKRRSPVVFIDRELVSHVDGATLGVPVVVLLDDAKTILPASIAMLGSHAWIEHSLAYAFLRTSNARGYLEQFLDRLFGRFDDNVLGATGVGRIALLANAARRETRLERMRAFFEDKGLAQRTIDAALDVTEELMMNALYDAPYEAGFLKAAVPRTQQIELPPDRACEISYGIQDDEIFVRLRDTFGALTRARIIDVLTRCSASAVVLDETRGGAGLGLWRIFSAASSISVTVVPRRITDIVVTIALRRAAKSLRATHFYFADPLDRFDLVRADIESLDQSFTLAQSVDAF